MTFAPRPPRIQANLDDVTDPAFANDESWEDGCLQSDVEASTAGNVKILGSLFRGAQT